VTSMVEKIPRTRTIYRYLRGPLAFSLAFVAAGCSQENRGAIGYAQDEQVESRVAAKSMEIPRQSLNRESRPVKAHIDGEWLRRSFIEDNLARWLSAAVTETGFFQTNLDRQWRPAARQAATLVSQSRLLYVFSVGYHVTSDAAYLQAVRAGAEFMLRYMRDEKYGGWYWSVSPQGKVLNNEKDSYGHAFVIFGLSHAHRVTREARYRQVALETWDEVKQHLRNSDGGFKRRTDRKFLTTLKGNSQNPMMHLFEALLALHDATGSQEVFQDAFSLAQFIFGRLYQRDHGYLPELYDADWQPLSVEKGGKVDIGHHFEWAFLLSRAVEKGFPPQYLHIGMRMLEFGMNSGYDKESGGIFSHSGYDGTRKKDSAKTWWQQCEFLRALVHYASVRRRRDLWEPFEHSLRFVKQHFLDPEYGGWYFSYDPDGTSHRGNLRKGSLWKAGYHATSMYKEMLRISELKVTHR